MAKFAGLSTIARTLGIANYRNYTAGNFVSQLGMWVQRIAIGWLTWTLTEDPKWLGIIAFADFFPNFIVAPLAGALADRLEAGALMGACFDVFAIEPAQNDRLLNLSNFLAVPHIGASTEETRIAMANSAIRGLTENELVDPAKYYDN